jgi:predicted permease
LALSLGVGVLFGLAPALATARTEPQGSLRTAMRSPSSSRTSRLRRGLVVAQVAFSAVSLIRAILTLESVRQLQRADRGYAIDNALGFTLMLPPNRYAAPEQRDAYFAAVIDGLRTAPGVERPAGVTLVSSRGRPFTVEEQLLQSREAAPLAVVRTSTHAYFATMGIPLVRGRDFASTDHAGAPDVAIVNQTFARAAWPRGDPVGRRIRLLGPPADLSLTVIGVAGDVKEALDPRAPLQLDARPTIYRPSSQDPSFAMTIVVRTVGNPSAVTAAVRTAVGAVDSTIPILSLQSMRQRLTGSMQVPTFNAVLTSFAVLAVLLAAVGVYGVIACMVRQRSREIGIQMALGAAQTHVSRRVMREGLLLACTGVVLGTIGALSVMHLIAQYLYGVRTNDPAVLATAAAILIAVAVAASYLPARRAAGIDPLIALRNE